MYWLLCIAFCFVFCCHTEECAGQFDLPVLGGVDVVAYWDLPAGAEPVLGTSDLMALWGDYRFFFSSIENLRTFQVTKQKEEYYCCTFVCIIQHDVINSIKKTLSGNMAVW